MEPTVTILGLGPAGPDLLTAGALEAIRASDRRLVRTARHPAVEALGDATYLDHHYERAGSFEEASEGIVEEVVAAAEASGSVLYAVPGSPMVAERTVEMLMADARVQTIVVPALSFADLAWVRLGVDPVAAGVRLVDAHRFQVEAAGERGPLLVAQVDTASVLAEVVASVPESPAEPVTVMSGLGTDNETVRRIAWDALPVEVQPDHLTCLYIPELDPPIAVELQRFADLVATLRMRCPWDAEQTHTSLRPHLLEEAYEVLEALDAYDEETGSGSGHLEEELGDLLFQVVFHARIAADDGRFDLADVARGIHDKLRSRHPHVFPEPGSEPLAVDGSTEVLPNWDRIKAAEKGRASALDGIPPALPALALAHKAIRRASTAGVVVAPGVDDPLPDGTALVDGAANGDDLGDLLMGLVRWAASHGVDAEDALRGAVGRFSQLVRAVEAAAAAEGLDLTAADDATRARLAARVAGSVGP